MDYAEINKEAWNKKVDIHINSEFYDNENFLKGASTLKEIELAVLSDVSGKSILHLQCHFGQDTISLARMGAQVTGVDISDKAIDRAREFASTTKTNAEFICCNLYDLPQHLDKEFDIVFSSYGTIGWLPDMEVWAGIVFKYLKPGGRFIFAEFHPIVWMYDDDFEKVDYVYSSPKAIVETYGGTYAQTDADITSEYVMWNHGLGVVINALIKQGLMIQSLEEYDYSPYDCFRHTEEFEKGKFRIKKFGNKIPLVYSLVAEKSKS